MDDTMESNYIDLFYQDGFYYAFNKETNKLEPTEFKYLLTLESEPSKEGMVSFYTVLSDDNTVTFEDFFKDMASSSSYMNGKRYEVVLSGTKQEE